MTSDQAPATITSTRVATCQQPSHADVENHLIQCLRFVDVRDFGEVKDARAHKPKEMGTLLIRNELNKMSHCVQCKGPVVETSQDWSCKPW